MKIPKKSIVVPVVPLSQVIPLSEEVRMVTETTTGINKEKINTLRETFLIRK